MKRYPTSFLEKLYEHKIRKVHSRIQLLDYNEKVLGQIGGIVMDGSINTDGNSAVRRNISLTLSIKDREDRKVFSYIDLSKKVKVEIGLENFTDEFLEEEIIWFNMGTYVLLDPSFSHDTNTMTMSLQAQDKMSLMNGTIGGILPTPATFVETNSVTGNQRSFSWREIFFDAATTYGGENPAKVVVSEVPDFVYDYTQVKTVTGLRPDFIHVNAPADVDGERIIVKAWDKGNPEEDIKFSQGERLYKLSRFGPPDPVSTNSSVTELYMKNPGDTVSSIFDNVVEELSNTHEYFYDRESNLVLQKVQNFINETFDPIKRPDLDYVSYELNMDNYIPDYTGFPFAYDFTDKEGVTAFTNNPSWTNIKNDFVVIGKSGSNTLQIAIDKKPTIEETREWFINVQNQYKDYIDSPDLEFLHLDGDYTRPIYDEATDCVWFLYKDALDNTKPIYVDVELGKVPWQIAHGLRNFVLRNLAVSLGTERFDKPRWGQECEGMILKYTKSSDGLSLVPNTGVFNPANVGMGNVWLAGYPTAQAAADVNDIEKLDYENPIFTNTGDSAYWLYYLDLIDEGTVLGKYSIGKIGKRTHVTKSDSASTIFRTSPRNLVVITEEELEKMGGEKVLLDLQGEAQPYAVIKTTTPKYYKRAEYSAGETVTTFPWVDIDGNPEYNENQYLVTTMGRFLVGGQAKDRLAFMDNRGAESSTEEKLGFFGIYPGVYMHPGSKQEFKNELSVPGNYQNAIELPFTDLNNTDKVAYICYIADKATRMPNSTSTDPLFAAVKIDPAGNKTYYASYDTGGKPVWTPFEYDYSMTGDVIVAVVNQESSGIDAQETGEDFSHQIDSYVELFNIQEATLASIFTSDGALDCFSLLRNDMYQFTNFSEVITVNCMPIYHLEPNTLIRVEDEYTDINGVYMITSYNLPLSISSGTMSINAIKVYQRI